MPNDPVSPDRAKGLINEFTLTATRWATVIGGLWIIVAVWALYLSVAVFGVDLVDKLTGRPQRIGPHDAAIFLVVAIVTSAITLVVVRRRLRRLRRLSLHSAEAEGCVVSVGLFSKKGLVPATVAYRVGGLEYTTKCDLLKEEAIEGRAVRVLYDPADPQSCEIMPR